MKATTILHELGQSLWLDNITRDLLDSGTLKRYIDALSVTGLTSNPTIFDRAIKNSTAYDGTIRQKLRDGISARPSSSSLRWRISVGRATCCGRLTIVRTAWTDGSRWRYRRSWPTTPRARSSRPRRCSPDPSVPIC